MVCAVEQGVGMLLGFYSGNPSGWRTPLRWVNNCDPLILLDTELTWLQVKLGGVVEGVGGEVVR